MTVIPVKASDIKPGMMIVDPVPPVRVVQVERIEQVKPFDERSYYRIYYGPSFYAAVDPDCEFQQVTDHRPETYTWSCFESACVQDLSARGRFEALLEDMLVNRTAHVAPIQEEDPYGAALVWHRLANAAFARLVTNGIIKE
jgi:hypothetical protein